MDAWRGKKVLITGGAGFIGSNLAAAVQAGGGRVVVFDNLSRKGAELNRRWLKDSQPELVFVRGDVRSDTDRLAGLAEEADVICHLAAQVAVTTSVEDPLTDFQVNALGAVNVLEAARRAKNPPMVLFTSTNKVYGGLNDVAVIAEGRRYRFESLPAGIDETRPLDFHSPYGCSKGAADQYVLDYHRIYGLKTVVFRMSCIYGPRQFGNEDQGWVAHFLISALRGQPLTIYGDGKQVRDILFVEDLVRAFGLAVQNIDRSAGQAYNIGGGAEQSLSLLELLDFIEAEAGGGLDVSFADWRPGDQKVYISDCAKAAAGLGWRPRVDVSSGLGRLLDWLRAHQELLQEALA